MIELIYNNKKTNGILTILSLCLTLTISTVFYSSATPALSASSTNHFVASVGDKKIKQLISVNDAVCVLLDDDNVYCWDGNSTGDIKLKDMTKIDLGSNAVASSIYGQAVDMREIDTGYHACAILKSEEIRCWGVNDDTVFDFSAIFEKPKPGTHNSKFTSYKIKDAVVKKMNHPVKLITNAGVICSIDQTNKLFCPHPHLAFLNGEADIKSAVFGEILACLHKKSGEVECYDMRGEASKKTITISFNGELTPKQFASRVIYAFGTCIIDSENKLACQEGDYDNNITYSYIYNIETKKMILPGKEDAREVQLSDTHACVLLSNGQVNCWGNNRDGKLGLNTKNKPTDTYLAFPGNRIKFRLSGKTKAMAIGHGYSCFNIENKVECFGKISSLH